MNFINGKCENVKISYIGGGSRGWAWGLMSDLVSCHDMNGHVTLYDIDMVAAENNVIIGNKFNEVEGAKSHWDYSAAPTLREGLKDADFVVISILPGTFDEMASDVHTPEKYGIYQSVGDTVGPGGIIRALRTIPMMQEIALAIKDVCPNAWVINYTNPMTICVKTLYKTFPEIKAFGCCHEVFGTQRFIAKAIEDVCGIENVTRDEIKVNVVGVNHFTWLTKMQYKNIDLYPLMTEFAKNNAKSGYTKGKDTNWMNNSFDASEKVKLDLFLRYGVMAAAGDRHLAEFCPGNWYLSSPENVKNWGFGLTSVDWRKGDLQARLEKSRKRVTGEEKLTILPTGEDGVNQMRSLVGLCNMTTNVNLPNRGQIPNLPLGAVVETNAHFCADSVTPCQAGNIPTSIYPLISRIVGEQETVVKAAFARNLDMAFAAFACDPLVNIPLDKARALFDEMVENTKEYLKEYK